VRAIFKFPVQGVTKGEVQLPELTADKSGIIMITYYWAPLGLHLQHKRMHTSRWNALLGNTVPPLTFEDIIAEYRKFDGRASWGHILIMITDNRRRDKDITKFFAEYPNANVAIYCLEDLPQLFGTSAAQLRVFAIEEHNVKRADSATAVLVSATMGGSESKAPKRPLRFVSSIHLSIYSSQ
jgi:hypothetical protein